MDGESGQLTEAIDRLLTERETVLLAIDGPSGAGKSTLGAWLRRQYDCNLFEMDHFFLRPEQRTEARLAEPGGNVDYERVEVELLRPLRGGGKFLYRPYDCGTQAFAPPVEVLPKRLNVVEGVYSLHPALAGYYDLKVFLEADEAERHRRLQARSPALYPRFLAEWIPMETTYFKVFSIREGCRLALHSPL